MDSKLLFDTNIDLTVAALNQASEAARNGKDSETILAVLENAEYLLSKAKTAIRSGPPLVDGLAPLEIEALNGGNKILAIKEHRARTSKGLKDSKDIVEAWINRHPDQYGSRPF